MYNSTLIENRIKKINPSGNPIYLALAFVFMYIQTYSRYRQFTHTKRFSGICVTNAQDCLAEWNGLARLNPRLSRRLCFSNLGPLRAA